MLAITLSLLQFIETPSCSKIIISQELFASPACLGCNYHNYFLLSVPPVEIKRSLAARWGGNMLAHLSKQLIKEIA